MFGRKKFDQGEPLSEIADGLKKGLKKKQLNTKRLGIIAGLALAVFAASFFLEQPRRGGQVALLTPKASQRAPSLSPPIGAPPLAEVPERPPQSSPLGDQSSPPPVEQMPGLAANLTAPAPAPVSPAPPAATNAATTQQASPAKPPEGGTELLKSDPVTGTTRALPFKDPFTGEDLTVAALKKQLEILEYETKIAKMQLEKVKTQAEIVKVAASMQEPSKKTPMLRSSVGEPQIDPLADVLYSIGSSAVPGIGTTRSSDIKVMAVAESADGVRTALVVSKDGRQYAKVGDIVDGWTITRITDQGVVLKKGNTERMVPVTGREPVDIEAVLGLEKPKEKEKTKQEASKPKSEGTPALPVPTQQPQQALPQPVPPQ